MPKDIKGITADSRAVQPGFLFAALPGVKSDGAEFINDAIARGATYILSPLPAGRGSGEAGGEGDPSHSRTLNFEPASPPPHPPPIACARRKRQAKGGTFSLQGEGKTQSGANFIYSNNPRRDFAMMVSEFYNAQPDVIFAVTGTNGKTSTATILQQIWESLGRASAAIGTLGVVATGFTQSGALTTPDPVKLHQIFAELKSRSITHVAIEASSHGIDQERLTGANIAAGIFTNLTRDHLDYHGTMENYFAAKSRLFTELLPDGAPAAINADDPYGQNLIAACDARLRVCSFGRNGRDLKLLSYAPRPDGFDVRVAYQNAEYNFYLPLLGRFQIWNVLGAMGALLYSGAQMNDLTAAIAKLRPVRGRLELVGRTAEGAPVFVDYAHTPDALETALRAVREHAAGNLSVVFGCGGDRDRGKRPLMGRAAVELAERVIVTDDNPRTENPAAIRAEVMAGTGGKAHEIGSRREAIAAAISELRTGDILIIAGKGHEQGQIIGEEVIPFDDASVAREFLHEA